MTASSCNRCRSRSWITNPSCSFPFMEYLVGTAADTGLPFRDVPLNVGAHTSSRETRTIQKVGVIDLCFAHRRNLNFGPPVGSAFYNAASLRKILEALRERLATIKRLTHLCAIHARKLEEHMGTDGENCRSHFSRILIKKLIRRYDCDTKLASFRQHRIDPASVGNEVLYFVAIDAIDRPLLASEERILNHGEEEACEGDCLLTQSSLREVDEDPVALIHRFTDRKRRLCLSDDMSEVRVGGEDRCFV